LKSLRNFAVVFAVSLIILGIAAIFACGYVADTVSAIFIDKGEDLDQLLQGDAAETTGIGTEGDDDRMTRPLKGSSFTWVMIVADYRPQDIKNYYPQTPEDVESLKDDFGILGDEYVPVRASNVVIIRADVEKREYVSMVIPTSTRVETPTGSCPLGDVYAQSGATALVDEVSSMTGLTVDYYTVLNSEDLALVTSTIGNIDCSIPVPIAFDGKNYVTPPAGAITSPEDTTNKETAAPPEDTSDKDDKDEDTKEPETTYVIELEKAPAISLSKKQLTAALLYMDESDGIDDEMMILQSFVNGLMINLSKKSDGDLSSAFISLNKEFVLTNITKEAVLDHAEVIRGYSWFKTQTMVYPGKYITGKAGREGYYNPDTNAAISFFAEYR